MHNTRNDKIEWRVYDLYVLRMFRIRNLNVIYFVEDYSVNVLEDRDNDYLSQSIRITGLVRMMDNDIGRDHEHVYNRGSKRAEVYNAHLRYIISLFSITII